MLEYYFSKSFVVLECNSNKLKRISNEEKNNSCNGMHDSDYVMTFTTTIFSISNTLKKLFLQYDLYSSYNQNKYIGKYEIIQNIFITYVEPLLNYINHNKFLQEWKINIDAPAYEQN